MRRSKQRTVVTILSMSLIAVLVIAFYYHITKRTKPSEETLSDVEVLLNKDLELYYPATPKEVVKLYSKMLQTIYTDLEDEQVRALAIKMRELYDAELLEKNPEEEHLNDFITEIVEWQNAERSITNFSFNEKENTTEEIDGREYAAIHVIYTFKEKAKYLQEWRFLLRKDSDGRWKILGWSKIPE